MDLESLATPIEHISRVDTRENMMDDLRRQLVIRARNRPSRRTLKSDFLWTNRALRLIGRRRSRPKTDQAAVVDAHAARLQSSIENVRIAEKSRGEFARRLIVEFPCGAFLDQPPITQDTYTIA